MQAFAKPKSAMRTAPPRSRLSIFGGESRVRTPAEKTAVRKAVPAGPRLAKRKVAKAELS